MASSSLPWPALALALGATCSATRAYADAQDTSTASETGAPLPPSDEPTPSLITDTLQPMPLDDEVLQHEPEQPAVQGSTAGHWLPSKRLPWGADAVYVSSGLLLSKSWLENEGGGVGLEVSVPLAWKGGAVATIAGPLVQYQHQRDTERVMLGLEVANIAGAELGFAMRFPHEGPDRFRAGLHLGAFLSLAVANLGPRFVLWENGVEVAFVFSVKAPIRAAGKTPFSIGHGRPWRGAQPLQLAFAISCASIERAPLLDARRWQVAGSWLRSAVDEQLSVATFMQLAADLRAHAAPAKLVRGALAAAREEQGHAARCLALFEGLTGLTVRTDCRQTEPEYRPASLLELASASRDDGVAGEGSAAHELLALSDDAMPAVRAQLRAIAREEQGHAALAEAVVDWAANKGGCVVRRALREAAPCGQAVSGARTRRSDLERSWGV